MSKRFTDSKKWRNEWFRTLPIKAKLTWIYLCDECENHGVIKLDYGLASFQLGFDITSELVLQWFAGKVYALDSEKILILQFFEFQYGESKDSWSAKIQAKNKLENLGFIIENNRIVPPDDFISNHSTPTVPPQSGECDPTFLIRVKGIVKGNNKKEDEKFDFEFAYNSYIIKSKGQNAEKNFHKQIKSEQDYQDLLKSIANYKAYLSKKENSWRKPKQTFAAYLGTETTGYFWKDFLSIATDQPLKPISTKQQLEHYGDLKKAEDGMTGIKPEVQNLLNKLKRVPND